MQGTTGSLILDGRYSVRAPSGKRNTKEIAMMRPCARWMRNCVSLASPPNGMDVGADDGAAGDESSSSAKTNGAIKVSCGQQWYECTYRG